MSGADSARVRGVEVDSLVLCTTTCQILRAPRRSYVGQAGSLRPIVGALWARPGERASPARETIWPPAARNIPRGWVAALLLRGAGFQPTVGL
jgi:hypothetical protein